MRISVLLSDAHCSTADPAAALAADRALVAAARDRLDGITLRHGWATGPLWNLQALTAAAYHAMSSGVLELTVHGLPLGVRNPIELAEQLATVDHACAGRLRVGLAIGTAAECALHGIDPANAAARFAEALGLLRAMWTQETVGGTGPAYVFAAVRPTLRPAHAGGPPLSLHAADADGAATAGRLGLGLHVDRPPVEPLLNAYRKAGGHGEISTSLDIAAVNPATLAKLSAVGVAQVDVRLRAPDTEGSTVDDLLAAARD